MKWSVRVGLIAMLVLHDGGCGLGGCGLGGCGLGGCGLGGCGLGGWGLGGWGLGGWGLGGWGRPLISVLSLTPLPKFRSAAYHQSASSIRVESMGNFQR